MELNQKQQNYLDSISDAKRKRMEFYINASNQWLKQNRSKFNPITLERVVKRLLTSSSLLSVESDSKTRKGSKNGFLTGILYLAPHKTVGFNLCPFAKTCIKDCLFNSGRGRFSSVTEARIIKTLGFLLDPERFNQALIRDVNKLIRQAKKQKMIPVVRLNGTSDLLVERVFKPVLAEFPDVQFYDYTKNPNRFKNLPSNYDLTFSFDGVNQEFCQSVLAEGSGRVAVVFKNRLPDSFLGFPVVNGDTSDLRFLDPQGVVVGLIAKGSAKGDSADGDFVIDPDTDSRCNAVAA